MIKVHLLLLACFLKLILTPSMVLGVELSFDAMLDKKFVTCKEAHNKFLNTRNYNLNPRYVYKFNIFDRLWPIPQNYIGIRSGDGSIEFKQMDNPNTYEVDEYGVILLTSASEIKHFVQRVKSDDINGASIFKTLKRGDLEIILISQEMRQILQKPQTGQQPKASFCTAVFMGKNDALMLSGYSINLLPFYSLILNQSIKGSPISRRESTRRGAPK